MSCLLLLAGNLNFKSRIVFRNNFFWRFGDLKNTSHFLKKSHLYNAAFKCRRQNIFLKCAHKNIKKPALKSSILMAVWIFSLQPRLSKIAQEWKFILELCLKTHLFSNLWLTPTVCLIVSYWRVQYWKSTYKVNLLCQILSKPRCKSLQILGGIFLVFA